MDIKEWYQEITFTTGASILVVIALFILTGGTLEIERKFGKEAQNIRYSNCQASPEVIEGKKTSHRSCYTGSLGSR